MGSSVQSWAWSHDIFTLGFRWGGGGREQQPCPLPPAHPTSYPPGWEGLSSEVLTEPESSGILLFCLPSLCAVTSREGWSAVRSGWAACDPEVSPQHHYHCLLGLPWEELVGPSLLFCGPSPLLKLGCSCSVLLMDFVSVKYLYWHFCGILGRKGDKHVSWPFIMSWSQYIYFGPTSLVNFYIVRSIVSQIPNDF